MDRLRQEAAARQRDYRERQQAEDQAASAGQIIALLQKNNRLLLERDIESNDAYLQGRQIEIEQAVELKESGAVELRYESRYISPRLKENYDKGVNEAFIAAFPRGIDASVMKLLARNAGEALANKFSKIPDGGRWPLSVRGDSFRLACGSSEAGGLTLYSAPYSVDLCLEQDFSGEVRWCGYHSAEPISPFASEDLNQEFRNGLESAGFFERINSESRKKARLENRAKEVVANDKQEQEARHEGASSAGFVVTVVGLIVFFGLMAVALLNNGKKTPDGTTVHHAALLTPEASKSTDSGTPALPSVAPEPFTEPSEPSSWGPYGQRTFQDAEILRERALNCPSGELELIMRKDRNYGDWECTPATVVEQPTPALGVEPPTSAPGVEQQTPRIASAAVDAREGEFEDELRTMRHLAANGVSAAQYNLGLMYYKGRGVVQDYAEAVKWYKLAAAQGDSWAQYNLGVMYDYGQGVVQDYVEAVKWYRLAAPKGDMPARSNLGVMYMNGRGVAGDDVRAHMWFSLGALSGDSISAKNIDVVAMRMTPQQISEAQELARQCQAKRFRGCD